MSVGLSLANAAAHGRAFPPGSVPAGAGLSCSFHPPQRLPCPAGDFLQGRGAQAHQEESFEHHR